jgi:transposase InsO family protein
MPWKVSSPVSLRQEFVQLASAPDANVSLLARRFGISRKTAYKWIARFAKDPGAGLNNRSCRPHCTPGRTCREVEQLVIELREKHPAWGARKLKRRLEDLQHQKVPARSTVNDILRRHGKIDSEEAAKHAPLCRFERAAPNELWQMDFKGEVKTAAGTIHPLTVLDDHSRFNILLKACENQQNLTVKEALTAVMRLYGMPVSILADNGPPWGSYGTREYFTSLGAWLIRVGISLRHGRPLHPQTQGKEERFHRTLSVEVLRSRPLRDRDHCQHEFDIFRTVYNHERPHEALQMNVPATRYAPSKREFPETLPPIEYGPDDHVRRVCQKGRISFRGLTYKIGEAFGGEPVALRPTAVDGKMDVFYCHQRVAEIDLRMASGDR